MPVFLPFQGHQGSHRVEICRPALCPVEISDSTWHFFNRFNLAGIGELEQAYQNQLLPYTGTPRFVALFCDICWDNRTGNFVASVASLASTNDMLRDPNFVLVSTPEYASDPEFTQLDVHLW